MKVMVLGSAAGGGFPQWNCNCNNCCGVRSGSLDAIPRTQSSIAVSVDGERWILFNASPDIRSQLEANPPLQPKRGRRDTGVHGVVLADSQIDHTTGLLFLREGCPLRVYCTDMVAQDLSTGFPIFVMLQSWDGGVIQTTVPIDGSAFQVIGIEEISITAIPLDGKAPPYSPHRHDPHVGDNVGYLLEDTRSQASLFYAPGLGQMSSALLDMMGGADCVMVDGTFWSEDEMQRAGVGTKLASDMGHLPQSGDEGMLHWLSKIPGPRKILIHINNTNPILIENSPERKLVEESGVEVAYDGMAFDL
ncbi:MAG: pyrroloquinoline quinone biosynthesis protein PqqB [Cellvibrionales bacterium]|nr:pyrroloquinoline quinone biosynthesis protein PqqB [Cellvibrionales bacterium]